MIIRSQDKENLINMANVCHFQISERNRKTTEPNIFMIDCCFVDTGLLVIGEYSTKEKASKVLDMIQEKYLQYATIENGFRTNIYGMYVLPRVFQMPLDREV